MKYTNINNEKISLLGLGCMRFPTLPGKGTAVDFKAAEAIIDAAYSSGVNYFDTAFVYNDGESEAAVGRALSKYPRGSYHLATKLPPWDIRCEQDVLDTFQIQLDRCGVDYFDFYLCHNLTPESWSIYEKGFIVSALEKLRGEGRIRRLGFSSHAPTELLEKFLDAHDRWDFVLLQLNYLDWGYLDMKAQYELVTSRGLPVMIMEPVRGGRLASLCPEADELLSAANPGASVASWAIRWAMSLDNVQVILSGMSSPAQVMDNVKTVSGEPPLTAAERETLSEAVRLLLSKSFVPCTLCNYCAGCPQGLNIPELIDALNDTRITLGFFRLARALAVPRERRPDKCSACGKCVEKCPQNIDIPAALAELAGMLSNTFSP